MESLYQLFDQNGDIQDLGIPDGTVTNDEIKAGVNDIYDPDNSDISYALNAGELQKLNNYKSKVLYGICPYAALKFGYFIDDLKAQIYFKLGITRLSGKVGVINDFIDASSKFHKNVPVFAFGFGKMLSPKCGISAEYVHTVKGHKNLGNIKWCGYNIPNKISLSKNSIRLTVTYQF